MLPAPFFLYERGRESVLTACLSRMPDLKYENDTFSGENISDDVLQKEVRSMNCPRCNCDDTRVIETRTTEEGRVVRRRRVCGSCSFRFTTYERVEQPVLWVEKKDGRHEAFDAMKLIKGISRSCERLPVSLETIEAIVARIEGALRTRGNEVTSTEIGELVMEELAVTNKVAYVRFASVYREFTDIESFRREIAALAEQEEKKKSTPADSEIR